MPAPTPDDVTVVVPTRNRLQVLEATLSAILGQVGVALQVVVVDEASSDGTGAWLDDLAGRDPRVVVVRHATPKRLPAARNAGIERATADWVAFCDDDDLWAPTKLASQLALVRSTEAAWSCTGVVLVDVDLEVIGHHRIPGGDVLRPLLAHNVIPAGGSSVLARTDLLRDVGGFDESLQASEDWELWIRLAARSPLASVDAPHLAYRLWPGSMSTDVDRMRASRQAVLDRHRDLAEELDVPPEDALYERYLAKQLLRAGDGVAAASIFTTLALRHGRLRELPRVPAAAIAPRVLDRLGTKRMTAAVPESWRRQADGWLAQHRPHGVEAPA